MNSNVTDVILRCSAKTVDDRRVEITYELTNQSSTAIHAYLGAPSSTPDMVCDAGDGAANVLLGISPLPRFSVYWKYHPDTLKLEAGQTRTGSLLLGTPILEESAYHDKPYRDYDRVPIDKLRLIVDFVRPGSKGFDPKMAKGSGVPESVACVVNAPGKLELHRRIDGTGDDDFEREFERRGTGVR